ncbi:MAG TPA: hypothetical protein VIM79_09245 [Niastella sp.]
MTQRTNFNKLLACLFVIGAFAGLYFQISYHKFQNTDTLSYINLAERYVAGDWQHAINGFWSPMYVWIISICKLTGLPALQSCYVINFLAAALGLYVLCKLAQRYLTRPLFYVGFCLYALLLMLFYSMSSLTPDLLAAAFCLWFLLLVINKQFAFNKRIQWLAGFVAAFAYFSKLYNFVPIHLFMFAWLAYTFFKHGRTLSKQLIPVIRTYSIFILLSCAWITVISIHEKQMVITTAGKFNHNYMSPDYRGPFPTNAWLLAPPFDKAYSAHTDPAHLLDSYNWSPFNDSRSFRHQVKLIKRSVVELFRIIDGTGAKWALLIVTLFILYINRKKIKEDYDSGLKKFTWFFFCYPLLYLPLFILDRYILVFIILFHLLLFIIAQTAWPFINKKIFVPVISVVLVPGIIPFVKLGQRKLTSSSGEYRYYKSFYRQLPKVSFLQGQSIASDRYTMVQCTQLCYYLNCTYYSTWADNEYQSLKKFNIRFLIAEEDRSSLPFLHEKAKMVFQNRALYIYEIQ